MALLDAGERLFTERGWDATRLADVAAEAGVSAATLYNHFPSKYVLIGRIFAQVYGPLQQRSQRLRSSAPSVPEAVAAHMRALAALTREYRPLTAAFACGVQEYTARKGAHRFLVTKPIRVCSRRSRIY